MSIFVDIKTVESMAVSESEILEGLDSRQREAVICTEGPELIVAGAGSGKTRVLTSRIAYLLTAKEADPSRILALTFTRKAAEEMKERIASMVGEQRARLLCMGTFHSVFVRFLRRYHDILGYPEKFTIYDNSDSVGAIKRCVKQLGLDEKVYKPKEVLSRISMAKNNLCTPEAYAANSAAITNDRNARKGEIYRIYARYQEVMKASGVMDFDDILMNMNLLLTLSDSSGDKVVGQIAGLFDYVLVDEYQDTNLSQYLILKKLCQGHRNLCVVGDDSQSIYAFRGAKIENMLGFRKDYPEARVFALERNYRSTGNIVGAANAVIARNASRIPKNCFSEAGKGEPIVLIKSLDEGREGLDIAASILRRMDADGADFQDFAVLYRTNAQSRAIEEALRRRNLPYFIYSGNSFYERTEIKDMMAYLKLTVNPRDDESFRRIVNKPARGIGDTTVEGLLSAAAAEGKSLMEVVASSDLPSYGVKSAAVLKLREFASMIDAHGRLMEEMDAYALTLSIAEKSGLYRFYKEDTSVGGQARLANVDELINSVKLFVEERHASYIQDLMAAGDINDETAVSQESLPLVSLLEFLENSALMSAVDVGGEQTDNRIALMTVHSSKGLEFPYVYVAGMEENLFPSGGMMITPQELEEERRLFYVAMTRARKALSLSFAVTRMRNGRHESNPPSRFLREMGEEFLANPYVIQDAGPGDDGPLWGGPRPSFGRGGFPASGRETAPERSRYVPGSGLRTLRSAQAPSVPAADFVPDSPLDLRAGMRIEHNRFGLGDILSITGDPSALKATIRFDSFGEKVLLLQYAKIRIVDK